MAAEDCIFCRIVKREVEASIVLDEEQVLAFMDVRQFHPGHTLVIPKRHIEDIRALEDKALAGALMSSIARVARAIDRAFAAHGLNVWQSTGVSAGQEVFHLHFHVMPRYEGDGLVRFYPSKPDYPPRAVLDTTADKIRQSMDR